MGNAIGTSLTISVPDGDHVSAVPSDTPFFDRGSIKSVASLEDPVVTMVVSSEKQPKKPSSIFVKELVKARRPNTAQEGLKSRRTTYVTGTEKQPPEVEEFRDLLPIGATFSSERQIPAHTSERDDVGRNASGEELTMLGVTGQTT